MLYMHNYSDFIGYQSILPFKKIDKKQYNDAYNYIAMTL